MRAISTAWRGVAWRGVAWRGAARCGTARCGVGAVRCGVVYLQVDSIAHTTPTFLLPVSCFSLRSFSALWSAARALTKDATCSSRNFTPCSRYSAEQSSKGSRMILRMIGDTGDLNATASVVDFPPRLAPRHPRIPAVYRPPTHGAAGVAMSISGPITPPMAKPLATQDGAHASSKRVISSTSAFSALMAPSRTCLCS